MKKILITGGCGFLGSNIACAYLKKGWKVYVIDKLFRKGGKQNKTWLAEQSGEHVVEFFNVDIADADQVDAIFVEHGTFDYICHLGGQVAMTTSLEDPRRDFNTNALGSFNILEAARKHSPDALVAYSSTNKVYGDLERFKYHEGETRFTPEGYEAGFDESLPLDFASPYGCSKGCADQYMRDWYRNFGLKTVVFRHSSIYGGRQFSSFDQGWIGWFCKQAHLQSEALKSGREPESYTIAGTGKQVRDVLHAEDLIALYQAAYENKDKVAGEVFNIGGGAENSFSLLELFAFLEEQLEIELTYEKTPRRQSDQDYFVADINKVNRLTGWSPQITKKQGIIRMLDWVKSVD